MSTVPARFLGYSFSAGDLLIETDENFVIQNADGATSLLGVTSQDAANGVPMVEFVSQADRTLFNSFSTALDMRARMGPMRMRIGADRASRRPLMVSVSRLPHDKKHYFFVISLPFRLGMTTVVAGTDTPNPANTSSFLERIEGLLSEEPEDLENIALSIMEAPGVTAADDPMLKEVEKQLEAFSVGGSYATRLSDNRFAAVFEEDGAGSKTARLLLMLAENTGLELNATSLDAAAIASQKEDGVRAAIFSLQKFADKQEGFSVTDLAAGYEAIIGETAAKVREFREVLNDHNFSMVYQPIVYLSDEKIHHYEALARFHQENLIGQQYETIVFAENVGLIPDFDAAVLGLGIEKLLAIDDAKIRPKLAINISGKSLSTPLFVQNLIETLKDNIILKDNLSLEVTESTMIHDLEGLNEVLQDIRRSGFKVYLDDFGAGASGFQYLKQLEIDGVKIDGDYVRDAVTDARTRAFLRSMATLCQDLGINTIAEWVQNSEQAKLLKTIGVTYGQGYYFGKPQTSMKILA